MTESMTPRGPYAKTAAVRQRILEAAMQVFAESGYRSTTVKEIADRAQISERGLVHHFANKGQLLTAVLARHDKEVALLIPNATGIDSFLGMIDVVSRNSQRPGIIELYTILATEAASPHHPAHAHYQNRYATFRRYIGQAFDALDEQGRLTHGLKVSSLAAAFTSLLEGVQVQWLYDRESVDMADTLRTFLKAVITDFPDR
jgi:AcrR family transcriptional regulator